MSEHLRKSIEELTARLNAQENEVANTKRAINALCQAMDEPPRYRSVEPERTESQAMRPDQFFGKPLASVVREVLEMRGHAMQVSEVMDTMKRGGYDFGDEKFAERGLRISLGKNTATFIQVKGSDSFGLVEWYPEIARLRRSKSGKQDSPGNGDNDSEAASSTNGESSHDATDE
ncbi:MAG TPA: hypothetical protein VGB22_04240 [candidate division Zixibacteria bacterium]|jgi:hypothetical protein